MPTIEDVPDASNLHPDIISRRLKEEQDAASELDSDEDAASDADSTEEDRSTTLFDTTDADFNDGDDVDDLLDLNAKVPCIRVKKEDDEMPMWASHGQLINFRDNSVAIADDYFATMKEEDGKPFKLYSSRKPRPLDLSKPQNAAAYLKGKGCRTKTFSC